MNIVVLAQQGSYRSALWKSLLNCRAPPFNRLDGWPEWPDVRSTFRVLIRGLVLFALLLVGCGAGPTAEDQDVLRRVAEEFEEDFEIKPAQETYIEARYLTGGCPPEPLARALHKALFLQPGDSPRRDTKFAYLNLVSDSGGFCYQLFFNPMVGELHRSSQAFY